MSSLSRVKREIEGFAAKHAQLRTCKFCAPHKWLDETDNKYSALFFDFTNARKEKNEVALSFTVYIADVVLPEETNILDVWSNCLSISMDLLSFLDRNEADYKLQDGIQFTPYTEATAENLGMIKADITIRIEGAYDRCVIPEKDNSVTYWQDDQGNYILTNDGQRIIIDKMGNAIQTDNGLYMLTDQGEKILINI